MYSELRTEANISSRTKGYNLNVPKLAANGGRLYSGTCQQKINASQGCQFFFYTYL
jgi:hypothetical protein